MKTIKRIMVLMMSLILASCLLTGCTATNEETTTKDESETTEKVMVDGIYTVEEIGHNAPVTLTVEIEDSAIKSINSDHLETLGLGTVAVTRLTERALKEQSIGFDAISGATITSYAVLRGLEKALTEAGADVDAWKESVEVKKTEDEEITTDVVIIGAGGSGLAAAVSAEQNGAEVIVVEQLGLAGGSTNVAGGAFNAVDDERQKAQGIEDSLDNFYTQTFESGKELGDPALIHTLVDNALPVIHWMESVGIGFKDEVGTATGALFQRSHYPASPQGNYYVTVFEDYIAKSNDKIKVDYNTKATNIILDEAGNAVGVKATNNGRTVTYYANKGVVISTGGFGANVDLRQEVNTGVWEHVDLGTTIGCTNLTPAAQGSGIVMGQEIGADVVGMSDIQLHPCGTPGTGLMIDIRTSGRNRLFVNTSGSRFVDEGAARDKLVNAIFGQEDSTYWIVVNSVIYPDRTTPDKNGGTIENMAKLGHVIEADTLEELAEKTGMDYAKLQESVDEYNKVINGEVEEDYVGFKGGNKEDVALTDGPWYACAKVPTVHYTMGGLKINSDAQVISTEGNAINGLYASGEVTGGIHGANRLGGNAIADAMIFGKIAGENVANSTK